MPNESAVLKLDFVDDISQIRDNIQTFNQEALSYPDIAKKLLKITTYWVYDSDNNIFGCSKFIGLKSMNFKNYLKAREE